jgi:hypothetical protein
MLTTLVVAALASQSFTAAQCEVQTSALSKREGVAHLCAALVACVTDDRATATGAAEVRTSALRETTALQGQVALLAKEKAGLVKKVEQASLAEIENQELLTSVDALEEKVMRTRAVAEKSEAEAMQTASALANLRKLKVGAVNRAVEDETRVVELESQLAALGKQADAEDGQRDRLQSELLKATSVAASSVKALHRVEANTASQTAAADNVREVDKELVHRLATAESDSSRMATEHRALALRYSADKEAADKTIADLKARLALAEQDRDSFRHQAADASNACAEKVRAMEVTQQKEMSKFQHLIAKR